MSVPFAKNALSSQIGGLAAAVAMAIGGMLASLESSASPSAPQVALQYEAPTSLELLRKHRAQQAIAVTEQLIATLDEGIEALRQMDHAPDRYGSFEWFSRIEIIRHVERGLDNELVQMRLSGNPVPNEVRQARKMLGLARVRMEHIHATLRRLEGDGESFESDIDLQGFHALADARSENVGKRFH